MTFRIYDPKTAWKSLIPKYRKTKTHKYIKPGDKYVAQYKVRNADTTKTLISSTIEFLAPQASLIEEILNVQLSLPSGGQSLALANNSETPLKFLNLTASDIMNVFGQNGLMMAVMTTDHAYKPTLTAKTLTQPINVTQNRHNPGMDQQVWETALNNGDNVYLTSDVYEITYQPVTATFLLLTTNLGISNYASIHTGIVIPLTKNGVVSGPNEVFNIDSSNNITWSDPAKVSRYLNNARPEVLTTTSIDKGSKLLVLDLGGGRNIHSTFTIPQSYFDGTPLVPTGMTPEDYIFDYTNIYFVADTFGFGINSINSNWSFPTISTFPLSGQQYIIPYHKSN